MKKIINDPFTSNFPRIDLHGEYTSTIAYLINDFINDNIKLKTKNIAIIHGKGQGLLKKKTHEILKINKRVKRFYINIYNDGETIVELCVD